MKKFFSTLLLGLGAFGALALAASYADARPYHHHGGARVGVFIGAGIIASPWLYPRPYYYGPYGYGPYPYGYYAPGYYSTVVEQPVVYTEQAQAAAPGVPMAPPPAAVPQAQQQYWYFCQDTQTYYPHVQNCATPWQRVVPHAPR